MATELELAHVTPMDKAREYLGLSWDEFCDYVDQGEVTPYLLRRKDGNRRLFVRFFGHKGGWPNPGYFKYDCGTYGTVFFDCDELRKFLDTFATQKDEEEAFTCPEQAGMTPPTVQGAVSTYAGNYGGYYYGAMQEYTGYQTGQATWPAYTATQRPQPMEPPKPMTQAPMAPKPATPLQTPEPLPPTPAPAPTPLPSPIGRQEEAQDNARVAELEEENQGLRDEIERLKKELAREKEEPDPRTTKSYRILLDALFQKIGVDCKNVRDGEKNKETGKVRNALHLGGRHLEDNTIRAKIKEIRDFIEQNPRDQKLK